MSREVKVSNTHMSAKITSDTQITLGRTLQDFGGAATKIWDYSPTFYPLIQREVQALENLVRSNLT